MASSRGVQEIGCAATALTACLQRSLQSRVRKRTVPARGGVWGEGVCKVPGAAPSSGGDAVPLVYGPRDGGGDALRDDAMRIWLPDVPGSLAQGQWRAEINGAVCQRRANTGSVLRAPSGRCLSWRR